MNKRFFWGIPLKRKYTFLRISSNKRFFWRIPSSIKEDVSLSLTDCDWHNLHFQQTVEKKTRTRKTIKKQSVWNYLSSTNNRLRYEEIIWERTLKRRFPIFKNDFLINQSKDFQYQKEAHSKSKAITVQGYHKIATRFNLDVGYNFLHLMLIVLLKPALLVLLLLLRHWTKTLTTDYQNMFDGLSLLLNLDNLNIIKRKKQKKKRWEKVAKKTKAITWLWLLWTCLYQLQYWTFA